MDYDIAGVLVADRTNLKDEQWLGEDVTVRVEYFTLHFFSCAVACHAQEYARFSLFYRILLKWWEG